MAAERRNKGRTRKKRRASRGRIPGGRWIPVAMVVVGLLTAGWVGWLDWRVRGYLAATRQEPMKLYAAPLELRRGQPLDPGSFERRLVRLGYDRVEGSPRRPGTWRKTANGFDLTIRGWRSVDGAMAARSVRLHIDRHRRIASIESSPGPDPIRLDPELLGAFRGSLLERHSPIDVATIPDVVRDAFLAAEDARFFEHWGVDPVGIARALFANVKAGHIEQGGSTITQQLAKNVFLSPERTWLRKANELVYALLLEARLSKEEILEAYLDSVYLGRVGPVGVHGLAAAARVYWNKDVARLDVGEGAILAGIVRAPNRYSPARHPERARARRDQVLDALRRLEWIDEKTWEAARERSVEVRLGGGVGSNWYVDEVIRRLRRLGLPPEVTRGVSVLTSVDPELQAAAERAVAAELEALEAANPRLDDEENPIEGALVVVDAESGAVRALVGGRDFRRSQFNRASRSRRQPGSAFKPFVFLGAVDHPVRPATTVLRLEDEPLELRSGGDLWRPTNYDGRWEGAVTARDAIERSRNVPTIRLALRSGIDRLAVLAGELGLGNVPAVPSIALGAHEVSLLDLTAAYTVFPNLGEVVRPALLRGVVGAEGGVLYRDELVRRRVATAPAAFVTTDVLRGVVDRGTGSGLRRRGVEGAIAGKTGTSNEGRDTWFLGFTPGLVVGAWVGYDDRRPTPLTGATGALPLWARFHREAGLAIETGEFETPDGVVWRDVGPDGETSGWPCDAAVSEIFIAGSAPTGSCGRRWTERPPVERERPSVDPWEPPDRTAPRRSEPPDWRGVGEWIRDLLRNAR